MSDTEPVHVLDALHRGGRREVRDGVPGVDLGVDGRDLRLEIFELTPLDVLLAHLHLPAVVLGRGGGGVLLVFDVHRHGGRSGVRGAIRRRRRALELWRCASVVRTQTE